MAKTMVKRKPKKATPRIGRKTKTAMLLEEKYTGVETTDWTKFKSDTTLKIAMYDTIRHLNYFYDQKDSKAWAVSYAKKHLSKDVVKKLEATSESKFGATGRSCRMLDSGAPLNKEYVLKKLVSISDSSDASFLRDSEESPTVQKASVSPADRLKNKTSEFIANIEDVLDQFGSDVNFDWSNYSVYNELQKITAASSTANEVIKYYTPLQNELTELVKKKTPDLVEAFSYLKIKERKQLLLIVSNIVADAQRYKDSKKAVASVRKRKPKSVESLVSKLKYAKSSAEFKVTSVNATNIVGAEKVLLFDTKYRTITLLTANSASGMAVKGTTIIGFDSAEKKKLRKPEVALADLLKSTRLKVDGVFNKLTTKASEGKGRCSDNTIILKVF